jgi:Mg2+/Co2+ transporter CorB
MIEKYKYDAALHVIIDTRRAVEELLTLPKTLEELVGDLTEDQIKTLKDEFNLLVETFEKVTKG